MNLQLALLILAVALQAADILSSFRAFKLGAVEANPLLAPLLKKFGNGAMLAVKAALVAALLYFREYMTLLPLGVLSAFYAYIVWNNVKVIHKLSPK